MPDAPRRPRRLSILMLGRWDGFDPDETCNLCCIWRPGPRSDERLPALPTFQHFIRTASLYRDREQGRVLVREWAHRHGEDADELLGAARL